MKVGLQISQFNFTGGNKAIGQSLAQTATSAEAAGFDSLWVMDHFFQLEPMIGPHTDPMMEAYTTLGYLAGVTQRVKLGALVTGVIYREPALLIKAVTTLDVLSGGRAYFGIGAGWYEREAKALGFLNPLTSERFERLEATLQLAKQMWANDHTPFKTQHYNLEEPVASPLPVSQPHPPILIGGGGEQKTLKLVAQYGDACNLFGRGGKEAVKHKLEVLRGHCQAVGRNFDDIEITVLGGGGVAEAVADPKRIAALATELAEVGVQHLMFSASPQADLGVYEQFAELTIQIHNL